MAGRKYKYRKDLSKQIKNARIGKKLSQEQLAEACGVSRQTVYRWEKGMRVPRTAEVKKIGEALGIPVEELLEMRNAEKQERFLEEVACATIAEQGSVEESQQIAFSEEESVSNSASQTQLDHAVKKCKKAMNIVFFGLCILCLCGIILNILIGYTIFSIAATDESNLIFKFDVVDFVLSLAVTVSAFIGAVIIGCIRFNNKAKGGKHEDQKKACSRYGGACHVDDGDFRDHSNGN